MVFILVWTRIGLSFSLLCEDFLKKLKVFFFIDFYGSLFYELINIWNEDFSSNFGQWCLCSSEEWTWFWHSNPLIPKYIWQDRKSKRCSLPREKVGKHLVGGGPRIIQVQVPQCSYSHRDCTLPPDRTSKIYVNLGRPQGRSSPKGLLCPFVHWSHSQSGLSNHLYE